MALGRRAWPPSQGLRRYRKKGPDHPTAEEDEGAPNMFPRSDPATSVCPKGHQVLQRQRVGSA